MRRSSVYALSSLLGFALWLYPENTMGAGQIHDVTTDWSDASNPNGVWRYRSGTTILTGVADWNLLTDPGLVQPAWAPGQAIPAWFKSASSNPEGGLDFLLGDVVVHTAGVGVNSTNVLWTSPIDGVVSIFGSVWMVRDIARSNDWFLLLNGNVLSGGSISGSNSSRANPIFFATGSGGVAAISDITVAIGDTIELRLERTSANGDFVAMDFEISDRFLFADGFE